MKKKDKKVITKDGIEYTISSKVRSYANDPFFVKKEEESVRFLEKAGFPDFPPRKK